AQTPGVFVEPGWGRVLAVVAIIALVMRIRRGNLPPLLWASLGIVFVFWALGAVAYNELRAPGTARYMYTGAVGVLLVASAAASGIRFTKLGLAALFAACAVGVTGNVALLRDRAAEFRASSQITRSDLAMLELARDHLEPGFTIAGLVPVPGDTYLAAADRYGSPGFSLAELATAPETVRENADRVLASALGIGPRPAGAARGCREPRTIGPSEARSFELPPGGATLRARGPDDTQVTLGRFATDPTTKVGRLAPGEAATLRIPEDSSPVPWQASIPGVDSLQVCPLR
ncbi:MAG: hypothetical protein ACRDGW_09915, partial [Actinomycetota bacterium]